MVTLSAGCYRAVADGEQWSLIALLDARGDLGPDARKHAADLLSYEGYARVAVQVVTGGTAVRGLVGWRALGGRGAPPAMARGASRPSGSVGGLGDFARWAAAASGNRHRVMTVLAHGTAPLDATVPPRPLGRLLVAAGQDEGIEAGACFAQLRQGFGSKQGRPLRALVLETCYGATLDNLWDAGGLTDLLLGMPGELPSPGIAWGRLLGNLDRAGWAPFSGAPAPAGSSCGGPGAEVGQGILALPADGIGIFRKALCATAQAAIAEPASALSAAQWARSRRLSHFRQGHMVGLADLATALAGHARGEPLKDAAAALLDAVSSLGRATGASTGNEGDLGLVALPLPLPVDAFVLDRYTSRSLFATQTRYGALLTAIADHQRKTGPSLPWTRSPGVEDLP